jgi:hypothetical protein
MNNFAYCEDKGTGPIKFLPLNSSKTTCWSCFKYILIDKSLSLNNYYFCDNICSDSYNKQEMVIFIYLEIMHLWKYIRKV